ncbi:MAG: hypothetical protein GY696_24420 [Gammaproteobacteria bacterium]|nr:hypothetical protein [Gammaproteobacteria bacterium]
MSEAVPSYHKMARLPVRSCSRCSKILCSNSEEATPFDQQLKRVFFTPVLGGQPQVYLTRTINFWEMAAGCYAIAVLKMTACMFGSPSLEEGCNMHVTDMVRGADVQAKPEAWRKDTVPVLEDAGSCGRHGRGRQQFR